MRHIESKTCIRFKKRTNEKKYVRIFKGNGCKSHVGRVVFKQELSLGEGCESIGII
ncbi:Astacin-like metalloprotease toxin, partial [Dinothrombium tinctorium]